MANNRVEVFVPNQDSAGNQIDASQLINSIQPLALANLTIQYEAVNIFAQETFSGQGEMLVWTIADANLAAAQSAYNTFVAAHSWIVTPHYLVTVLAALE